MKIGLQTWGSNGDIRPFLALATALSSVGHDVTVVVTNLNNTDYSDVAQKGGFTIRHVGGRTFDPDFSASISKQLLSTRSPLKQTHIILEHLFDPLTETLYESAQQLCEENEGVISHFMMHPLRVAAEKTNTPLATLTLNHSGIASQHNPPFPLPNWGPWINRLWWLFSDRYTDKILQKPINTLRHTHHLKPITNVRQNAWTSDRLNLIAVSRIFCQPQPDWPDYHQICGFLDLPESFESWTMPKDLRQFFKNGSPPIFITLYSMLIFDTQPENITQRLYDAVKLSGCRAIIQSQWDKLPQIPDDPRIYKIQYASFKHIFPHCAAIVHHGGVGTSHVAVACGRPSIVIEHAGDQPFWATQLHQCGVALKMLHRQNLKPHKLVDFIQKTLNHSKLKSKAKELSEVMKTETLDITIKLIEEKLKK